MGTRLQLHSLLQGLVGDGQVYFQPPENIQMSYPAIVYNRNYNTSEFADNGPYRFTLRYQVTVIDADPDSVIPLKIIKLPLSTYVRHFNSDNLNHDIIDVYF